MRGGVGGVREGEWREVIGYFCRKKHSFNNAAP